MTPELPESPEVHIDQTVEKFIPDKSKERTDDEPFDSITLGKSDRVKVREARHTISEVPPQENSDDEN